MDEPFTYLPRILSDRLTETIKFPYQEIEIQLAFLSSKVKEIQYLEWYSKLPNYYRGKNMIRVILPVTERKSNLLDIFGFIYKAFDIIISKKKKNDFFDETKIKPILLELEQELKASDLLQLHFHYKTLIRQEAIERNRQERTDREQNITEKKRLIRDLRFYYHFDNIGKQYFLPYDNYLCHIILEKLRKKKFSLPIYTHLYIMVSDSFENALHHAVRLETWFAYGIAVLEDYDGYADKNETEKKRIVFELIKQGLYDIAKVDKLDIEILNQVLNEVNQSI